MQKNSCFTRTLSVVLSILMALSCVSLLRGPIIAFAENFTSVTDAQWNELAAALASDNVKNAAYVTSGNDVTVDDPSGDVTRAAKAYYAIFNASVHKATSGGLQSNNNEYNLGYRTSQQIRDKVKNEMQSRMGAANYNAYGASSVLDKLGGPTVSGGESSTQNNITKPSFSFKVTNFGALTSYATLEEAASVPTYSYSVTHRNDRYYETTETSGSGCNATTTTVKHYYAVVATASAAEGYATQDITALEEYSDALDANAGILNASIAENINLTYAELAAVYNTVTAKRAAAIEAFGAPAVAHFFSSWDAKIDDLNKAMLICQYKPIVDEIKAYVDADISRYDAANDLTDDDLTTITRLYNDFKTKYTNYKNIGINEVYNYFEVENNTIVRADVEAALTAYQDAYEITHLKVEEYPLITGKVAAYGAYDDDWVLATDNASSLIEVAITTLSSNKTTLGLYKDSNVDAVFGAGYKADVIDALISDLQALYPYDQYKNDFYAYKSVYDEAFAPVTPDYTDAQLYDVLNAKDAWYTQLQAFAAEVEAFDAAYAAKLFGELEATMEAKIESVYELLNSRVSNNVLMAYDLYQNFVSRYGHEVTNPDDITMENYRDLRMAFNTVSDQHYLFLDATVHSTLSEEVKEKYAAIRSAVIVFKDYQANLGTADYLFESSEIADYIRYVSDLDVARNADYTVTDPNVEALINMLDGVLTSDGLKETFDLGGTLSGVLDGLYTDDFINTLVQYVYPMVALEFAKVWADLPSSVPITDPVSMTVNLSIQPMGTALENIKLYILPKLLAKNVQTDYPDAYAKLNAVSNNYSLKTDENGDLTWNINPWQDANIYDPETEKLTIEWGVTDKESFLNAATAALSGVAPLLLALLSNQTANIGGQKIGTGSGTACLFVNVTVDPITLKLTFEGNPGYNNALAPILAALGAENIPDGNDLDTVAKVLDLGIITPFESILNKLAAAPIDFLTNVLPSLAFALNFGLVQPLLSELKTQISYSADAHYSSSVQSGDLEGALQDSLTVNIGEMLDLADMGIDITSLNGLIQSIIGLVGGGEEEGDEGAEPAAPALELPDFDAIKLAQLTTGVTWSTGHRTVSPFANVPGHGADFAHLTANRADVFLYLIDWFVAAMEMDQADIEAGKKNILLQIIDMINAGKEEGEEPFELPEILQTILDNFVTNYTDSVAAVVELTAPQRYSMESVQHIDWITTGNIGAGDYSTFWTEEYSEYTKTDWTREDALYVEEHLEETLNNVVKLLSDQLGGAETLGEAVEYLAGSLITADTAAQLVDMIKNLLGGLELPDMLSGVFEQLGLDLTAWDNMTFNFEDGDLDGFKAALIQILTPVQPLLAFLFAGQDIEITLLDALTVKALAYDGYSYGLVPLLETLGATGLKSTSEFIADSDNVVANIVEALYTVVDQLIDNPLTFIKKVAPAVVYFDKVGGLKVVIDNLLFGVNVLLDTIRPIYPLNLDSLITADAGVQLPSLEDDLLDFLIETVIGVLADKFGVHLSVDYTVATLTETLHFTDPTPYTSANGDTAYTVALTEDGQAELLVRILDYLIEQIAYEDNAAKITEMLGGLIGDNETVAGIVDQVMDNLVNNYPDSVLAVFKVMYPRVEDREDDGLPLIQVIEWITTGKIVSYDNYWTVEEPEYVAGVTPWTQEKGEFMAIHLSDVVANVLKLVGGADNTADAVNSLLAKLLTADNANKIAEALAGVLDGLELPDMVKDLGVLEQLGFDASYWAEMSFSFADGDVDAFKAALTQILNPLNPLLAFLLAEGTITVADPDADPEYGEPGDLQIFLKDALPIRGFGYDGYSYGIVPILEALGADVMAPAAFKAQKGFVVKNIVDMLFTVVDHLAADPLGFVEAILPELLYFDDVKVLSAAIPNLLYSVTVLLDTVQPLYDVDLYALVAELTATDENPEGFDLTMSDFSVADTLFGFIPGLAESAIGLKLDAIELDKLLARISYTPAAFTSANGDTAYRAVLATESKAVLLTTVLDYVIAQIGKEENVAAIKELLSGLGLDESASAIVDQVIANLSGNYTDSVFALFQLMYPRVKDRQDAKLRELQVIDWITEGNIGSDEPFVTSPLPEGETTLWTAEKAVYMAEHLGDFLNDIVVIFGEQLGGAQNVDDAVGFLVKDIFTVDNANAIRDAVKNLASGIELPAIVTELGVVEQLGLDPANWEGMTFSFAAGDRTAFKNALIKILKPLEPVLAFLLADAPLTPVDSLGDPPYGQSGNLEVYLKDAVPVRGLGYDGYSYGIVPLLEALGASGVKTTAAFKADKNNVVKNIVDPLFTVVDHLIADPIKFIETVIPSLLYFDKVGGVQAAVPNLLFSVSVLLDTISPLYDGITMDDLYALIEEKTGIDITFANSDPIDLVLNLVTDLLKDNFGIEIQLGTAAELTDALQFNAPKKFKSANGDDAYTVTLTADGKAELLSRILDYGINQVIAGDNFEKLNELLESLITDDDTRAMAMGILRIIKDADKDFADFHGVHDFTLASLFWVFFGADSVTDAVSDFFYRFKDSNWYEIIFMISENAPEYVERAGFLLTEVYNVEYPAFQKIYEERQALLKPPYEYNEEETEMAAGIGARIIRFFAIIIHFFKNLFKR